MKPRLKRILRYVAIATIVALFLLQRTSSRKSVGLPVLVTPDTCTCNAVETQQVMHLQIAANGMLYLNSDPVQREQFEGVLQQLYASKPEKRLYISAEPDAEFQAVADIINAVQTATYPHSSLNSIPVPSGLSNQTMNIQVWLLTNGAAEKSCDADCYNWGIKGIPPKIKIRN